MNLLTTPIVSSTQAYLAISTLIIGVMGGLYLFYIWLRHKRQCRFLLFWSIGLFLFYWFQIPAILASTGFTFTITDFNLFYMFAFPATFLAFILFYVGLLSISSSTSQKKVNYYLTLWFITSLAVFIFYFSVMGGQLTNYTLPFLAIFLFFLPLQLLILYTLLKWYRKREYPHTKVGRMGILVIVIAFLVVIIRVLVTLKTILVYSPELWFLAVSSSSFIFLSQSLSILLLLIGFFLIDKSYRHV